MVHRAAVIALVVGSLVRCMFCVLRRLLCLATLHLGFFQQTLLLGKPFPLFAVLDLVLPDERFRWPAKDALVFTELADPNVFQGWWVVNIGVLLLYLALTRSQRVHAGGRSFFLGGHGSLVSLSRGVRTRRDMLIHRCGHVRTRLCPLCGESTRILRRGRKR